MIPFIIENKDKYAKCQSDNGQYYSADFSHSHAMISEASRTNDGIRCIRKAAVFCQKVRSEEKESNANKLTKRIAKIHSILAVQ